MEIKSEHKSACILLFQIVTKRNLLFLLSWLYLSLLQGYLAPVMFVLAEQFARGRAVKPVALYLEMQVHYFIYFINKNLQISFSDSDTHEAGACHRSDGKLVSQVNRAVCARSRLLCDILITKHKEERIEEEPVAQIPTALMIHSLEMSRDKYTKNNVIRQLGKSLCTHLTKEVAGGNKSDAMMTLRG